MPYAEVAGGPLWYAEHGRQQTGLPPVVLVHGAGGSRLDWPGELRRLPGRRVLVPDLPGHGRSAPPGHGSIESYAAAVEGFLAALEIPRAMIGGHSMGAAIALMLALRQPEAVAGLVLFGGAGRLPVAPVLLAALRAEPERAHELLVTMLWGDTAPEAVRTQTLKRLRAVDPAVLYGDYRACDAFDLTGRLGAIAAPALVIAGEFDRMVSPERSRALASELPAAELVMLPGAGHMLALQQPAAAREAVLAWLDRD